MVYRPQALDTIEMAFEGLSIEWFKVENHAPVVQKQLVAYMSEKHIT